jgi:hypothetical protein
MNHTEDTLLSKYFIYKFPFISVIDGRWLQIQTSFFDCLLLFLLCWNPMAERAVEIHNVE